MFKADFLSRAEALISLYREQHLMIATAESCTGGLVAALLTSIAGSSVVVERGFVTYSNAAKSESLGVPQELLNKFGAVSSEVAKAMASGALAHSKADVAVSVTGIAGPGGGSEEKPVGLVHFACARRNGEKSPALIAVEKRFGDLGRAAIRAASVEVALSLLSQAVQPRTP
ncbi:MAG TPA: CinA family protein [Beijerinckia sp.]|jgi:nicotinamide-nucleotide amidase|nr:CinA family protein [Beijerinckia sp.]